MQEDRIWNLVGKQLDGTASPEEEKEIEEWKKTSAEQAQLYDLIYAYLFEKSEGSPNPMRAWNKVKERIADAQEIKTEPAPSQKKFVFIRALPIAAAIALLLLVGYYFFLSNLLFLPATEIVKETPRRIRTQVALPDGSKVWLNADSKLTYPKQFGETSREVSLTGEAFFEVERNPERPFIIHLENDTRLQVLGTSFNVKRMLLTKW